MDTPKQNESYIITEVKETPVGVVLRMTIEEAQLVRTLISASAIFEGSSEPLQTLRTKLIALGFLRFGHTKGTLHISTSEQLWKKPK